MADIDLDQNTIEQLRSGKEKLIRTYTNKKKGSVSARDFEKVVNLSRDIENLLEEGHGEEKYINELSTKLKDALNSSSYSYPGKKYSSTEDLLIQAPNLLGLAPISKLATSVIDIKHAYKDWVKKRKDEKDKVLGKMASGSEFSGTTVAPAAERPATPAPGITPVTPTIEEAANKEETSTDVFKRRGKTYEAERNKAGQIQKMTEIDPIHAGLIKFFSTSAFRTRWTKQLLEAVLDKSPEGPKKESPKSSIMDLLKGGLGAIGSMIAPMMGAVLPVLLPIIAVALAGLAGAALGKLIGGLKIGDKTIDQHVESGMSKVFEFDEKNREKKMIKDTANPLQRRMLELQTQNPKMTAREAMAEANKEGIVSPGQKSPKIATSAVSTATLPPTPATAQATNITPVLPTVPTDKQGSATTGMAGTQPDKLKGLFDSMRPQNMAEFVTDARKGALAVTNEAEKQLDKVPVDTTQSNIQKEVRDMMEKLKTAVTDMHQTLKDGNKNKSSKKPSGYDANNTRNPVLSSLGAGQLDISSA